MMTTENRLSGQFIDAKPVDFEFGEGFGNTWETVYPDVKYWDDEMILDYLQDYGYTDEYQRLTDVLDDAEADDDDKSEALSDARDVVQDRVYESNDFEPMMDYIYPIDVDHEQEAQTKLMHLPVVVVSVNLDGTWSNYLALSGGGMDLSWEICEAYTRLGYLPPVHFCDLPAMADRGESDRDKRIIAACRESVRVLRMRLDMLDSRLSRLG